jgi:hypothetical protein
MATEQEKLTVYKTRNIGFSFNPFKWTHIADLKVPFDNKWITMKEFAGKSKSSKLSIPTDEEIEQKAEHSVTEWLENSYNPEIHDEEKEGWAKEDYCTGYTEGYKQALKDLGYADN